MKSVAKKIGVVLANIIVLAVLLEVGGNIYFLIEHGRVFYTRERLDIEGTREQNPFMSGALRAVVHPYFGFVYKTNPGGADALRHLKFNNHGFMFHPNYDYPGCCDFPSRRSSPDEVFVGVFGGSVAGGLAYRMQESPAFADALRALPRFAGKQIRILPFALGGYKQPQQLMVLAYYLALGQPIDVVINVDGFNELMSDPGLLLADMDVGYPDASLWLQLVRYLEDQARPGRTPEDVIGTYHGMMWQRWARRAINCQFVTCYTFARLMQAWHQNNATDAGAPTQVTAEPPYFFQVNPASVEIKPSPERVGGVAVMENMASYGIVADHWVRSSQAMQALARSEGLLYVHALQPNPWFRRSSPYVPRAPSGSTEYLKKLVPIGYSALLAQTPRLAELGVNFVDATAVLDNEPNSVYSDDVGHFTPHGYDLVAAEIVKALASPDIH